MNSNSNAAIIDKLQKEELSDFIKSVISITVCGVTYDIADGQLIERKLQTSQKVE